MNISSFKIVKTCFCFMMLASVLMQCSTIVDIDIDLERPIVVANSLFSPDSVWQVSISKTSSILIRNPPRSIIGNANVGIYDKNNTLVETLTFSPVRFNYRGTTKPKAGENYTLKIQADNEALLQATDQIPASVPIAKVEVDSSRFKSQGEPIEMKVVFNDPAGVTNFYEVKIIRNAYYIDYVKKDTIRFTEDMYVEPVDPAQSNDESNGNGKIFNDNLFNGKQYNFHLKMRSYGSGTTEHLRILLLSVTPAYYQYFTTRSLQSNTSGDPFAQPTLVFSNIDNGLGIFAGYSYSVFSVK